MWTRPVAAVVWLLGLDTAVAVWTVAAGWGERVSGSDWVRFGTLAAIAVAYLALTRQWEERRRLADNQGEHVDQTSVFVFSAALLLPVWLLFALIALLRHRRFLIARKPPHSFLFTTAAITAGALGVHAVAESTPLGERLTGALPAVHDVFALDSALAMIAAMAVYFVVQGALIGVARGLINRTWSPRELLGEPSANVYIVSTLVLAVCLSVLLSVSVVLGAAILLVIAPLARMRHQLAQATADRKRLLHDALTDPLTRLPNRRGFEPAAQLALVADQAARRPTAFLYVDVDRFKEWNTRIGHAGADQLLAAIAAVLRHQIRGDDLPCRWGGEELCVVLPNTTLPQAIAIAERIRTGVRDLDLTITRPAGGTNIRLGHEAPPCTVSIGAAVTPTWDATLPDLAELADEALSTAKATGRNRVIAATSPAEIH
ncbi:GGDEF domain-containing protein [Actinokineospora auranticolor]|uniref:GGDEF domain-containing protein n=1 Tax=Actinokineospora auranticolor TaxID=155976 RepID=UPI0035A877D1